MIFKLESRNYFLLSANMWHTEERSVDLGSKTGGIKKEQPEGCWAKIGHQLLGRPLNLLTCMDKIKHIIS